MSTLEQYEAADLAEIKKAWREDYGESPEKLQEGYNKAAMAMSQIHIWCKTPEERKLYKKRWESRLGIIKALGIIKGIPLEPVDSENPDDT